MSASMVKTLWRMVNDDAASDADLESLASGEDLAIDLSGLASVVEGIAMLVSTDGLTNAGAGNFQSSESVTRLLLAISGAIGVNAECSMIATQAQYLLSRRALMQVAA